MRLVLALLVLSACSTSPAAVPDSGAPPPDAGAFDAGADSAPLDAGTDATADAGEVCACSGVSACCDGCHAMPTSTVCASSDGPDLCDPGPYVTPALYGHDETITRCGSSGACDGVVSVVEHRWACPGGYWCRVRSSDQQAICDHP